MHKKLLPALLVVFFTLSLSLPLALANPDSAHVRFGHFAADAPNVDIYVNGEIAMADFAPTSLSDFMPFEAGTLTITIVPTGEAMEAAVLGPEEITVEAEHNVSISVIGQAGDDSLTLLTIDETAEMADCDMSKNVFRIMINNIAGGPAISIYENNEFVEKNLAYGTYSTTCITPFFWDTGKLVVGEDLDTILFDFDSDEDGVGGYWEPYTVYFWGLMGSYPGAPDEDYYFGGGNWYTVAPDAVAFLSAFSGLGITSDGDPIYEFNTAAEAIQAVGLEETLAIGGPYTLFIPTDAAFAALPEGTLADPDPLKAILSYHVVQGVMSYDDLVNAGTVKTLQGAELTIAPSEDDGLTFTINGSAIVVNFDYPLPNGNRIWFIENQVLMPPAE